MSVSIPSSFDFGVDLGVDLDISGIPTSYSINANVAPMSLNLGPIDIRPIDFSLRVKEIPAIRAHLPLDYRVGLTVLGAVKAPLPRNTLRTVYLCDDGKVGSGPRV